MKKIIIAVVLIVAVFFLTRFNNKKAIPVVPNIQIGWQAFENKDKDFGILYPTGFLVNESTDGGFYSELDLYTLSIKAPDNYQQGTDLNVATVIVSVSDTTSKCFSSNSTDMDMTETKSINGKVFNYNPKQPFDDNAMGGQRGTSSIFSTVENAKCYRIQKLKGYRDLRGFAEPPYPPHFDEVDANKTLEGIIGSFKFL